MTVALAVLVLLPALTGAGLLLAGRRADRAAGPVAVALTGAGVALAAWVAGSRPRLSVPFLGIVDGGDLRLVVDGLSAVLVVLVAGIALLVTVFAVADLPSDAAKARFFGFILLFVAAMLATVTAATLPVLLLAWEVMGAASYALIGFRWEQHGKLAAGTRAFLTTRAADLGLYVAAGAALAATGSLVLADLHTADGGWADLAAAGVLVAALGKSAQLPFSAWLSAAMQGPSPVSALLHSATMVAAGGYLLIRMQPLLAATGWAATAAAWAGALTALVLGAVAVAQSDLKQLLAASTAAQLGFVVLAAGVGATAGGTAHLAAHAAVKAGLFVAAGGWLTALGTKNLAGLRGAARRYPGIGAAAAVAALALAGVPPLSLWATEDQVLAGVDGAALHAVGLAAAAVSAVYAGRILAVILARPAGDELLDREEGGSRRIPVATTVVACVLAVFAAGLGLVALPAAAKGIRTFLGAEGEASPGPTELLFSGALAVVALGLTVAVVRTRPGVAEQLSRGPLGSWAWLGRLLSPRPAMALARALAAVDDRVLDRAVMGGAVGVRRLAASAWRADDRLLDGTVSGVASATRRSAAGSARIEAGALDGAVRATARAFVRAGRAARRPQTGLLHQYYAQVVIGLGFLLVLLLVVR
jgi:NADH-quinone oxidoreductase subunit L